MVKTFFSSHISLFEFRAPTFMLDALTSSPIKQISKVFLSKAWDFNKYFFSKASFVSRDGLRLFNFEISAFGWPPDANYAIAHHKYMFVHCPGYHNPVVLFMGNIIFVE